METYINQTKDFEIKCKKCGSNNVNFVFDDDSNVYLECLDCKSAKNTKSKKNDFVEFDNQLILFGLDSGKIILEKGNFDVNLKTKKEQYLFKEEEAAFFCIEVPVFGKGFVVNDLVIFSNKKIYDTSIFLDQIKIKEIFTDFEEAKEWLSKNLF